MNIKYPLCGLVLAGAVLVAVSCAPAPAAAPTSATVIPEAAAPTEASTPVPTAVPTIVPTATPAVVPTEEPTVAPTAAPTGTEIAGMPAPTLLPDVPQSAEAIQRISAEELKALLDGGADLWVVDTQLLPDYANRQIPGAYNLPWAEEIIGFRTFPQDKLLVLYDAHPESKFAADVAMQLIQKHGYTRIMLLEGGLQRWAEELGYPFERSFYD